MVEIALNTQLVKELVKLSTSKLSNFPTTMESVCKRFGVSTRPYTLNGFTFLRPIKLTEAAGGHNYPLDTPLLPILSNTHDRASLRTLYMMCLYVQDNRFFIGNWTPPFSSARYKHIATKEFLDTLPPNGPVQAVSNTGYPSQNESDISEFSELMRKLAARQGVARG